MALTLTPEQEQRITTYARQKQKPVERVIDEWIHALPTDTPETETLPQESKTDEAQAGNAQPTAGESAAGSVSALEDEDNWNAPALYDTLSDEEFEKEMDSLAELGRGWGSLPDSAFDRETLYEDRI